MKILVAYATKNGSTEQVAAAIADTMHARGADVSLRRAGAVTNEVGGYDLVVIGAPLYSGRWHKDASRFLRRHRPELAGVRVAVFGMGPREDTEEAWRRSRAQLDRALAKRGWLAPAAVMVFGGADPPGRAARQRRDGRQPRSRGQRAARDLRDWQAISAWAGGLLDAAAQAEPSHGAAAVGE